MELGNIIAIILIAGFVGFIVYKIKSKKDNTSTDTTGGGSRPSDSTNVKRN